MSNHDGTEKSWSLEHRLMFGQAACLFFGLGLIMWGLAPTMINRVLTGEPPSVASLAVNLMCFLVAVMFIGFHLLIKKRVRWAAWSAFLISCIVLGGGVAISFATGFQFNSSFILLLSVVTCFATWLAIEAIANWPIEGPFAREADEELPASRPGYFVSDGPVLNGSAKEPAQARMFGAGDTPQSAGPVPVAAKRDPVGSGAGAS